jgi:hypothetical protein
MHIVKEETPDTKEMLRQGLQSGVKFCIIEVVFHDGSGIKYGGRTLEAVIEHLWKKIEEAQNLDNPL